jgi:hypothetical protein
MCDFVQHGVSEEALYQGNLEHAQNLPEVVYEVISPAPHSGPSAHTIVFFFFLIDKKCIWD